MARRLPVLVALGAALAVAPAAAQRRPDVPVVFDDFSYADSARFRTAQAWTDLAGRVLRTERAWYVHSWDEAPLDPRAHVRLTGEAMVLVSEAGLAPKWVPGRLPAAVMSGFRAASGTWVASVRADRLRDLVTNVTHAFWTMTPGVGCSDARCARDAGRHWSEFNHEWNNYFDNALRRRFGGWMSNGAVVNGEAGQHTGAGFMRHPTDSSAAHLSCAIREGTRERRGAPEECVRFLDAGRPADPDRHVTLLIRYDHETITFALRAHDGTGRTAEMARAYRLGREAQPMTAMFSTYLDDRCFAAGSAQPAEQCTAQRDLHFTVDWFLYTPSTSVTAHAAEEHARWMQARALRRVNTTGIALAAPPPSIRDAPPVLKAPLDVAGPVKEWMILPNGYPGDAYLIRYRHRTRRTSSAPWSAWSDAEPGGLYLSPPFALGRVERAEVDVTLTNLWPPHNTKKACTGVSGYGATTYRCAGTQ